MQELQLKFEVDRIELFLENLEDAELEWFWQAINDIHNVFPNIDIYHAGSGKYGYLGFGIKPVLTSRVKDFLLVSHLGNNEDGKFYFKLEVIQALADFITEFDSKFALNFSYKNLANEKFVDWLYKLKEYAIQFGMTLDGQGLLPLDYQNQSLNAAQAVEYLKERYPGTYSGTIHIAAFKTPSGREFALDPKSKTPIIFCDHQPPEEIKLLIKKEYSETAPRHHHLATHAKTLQVGNKIFSVLISNLNELEKFCEWYEQAGDQITALERKIKAFLELWPVERLKNLTVEEYHQAKNKECFIAQIDTFDPTQGDPTFSCYFDFWEPVSLGDNEKYHNQRPYSWNKRLGNTQEQAFQKIKQEILDIVDAAQHRDLNAIDQIQFTKGLKWIIAFLYQDFNDPFIIPIVSRVNTKRIGYEHLYPKLPLPEFLPILLADKGEQAFFPYVEKLFALVRKGYLDNKQKKQQTKELVDEVTMQQPLNRILFGAAGTGKTYHTINHALSIIENKPLDVLESEARKALKESFDQYKKKGQIKFVTFHQSFSYEDFVEGIRAETDEDGNLKYPVKAGVFKEICTIAKNNGFSDLVGSEFGRGYILQEVSSDVLTIKKPNGNLIHLSLALANLLLQYVMEEKITIDDINQKQVIEKLESNEPLLEPFIINGYCTVWAKLIQLAIENFTVNENKKIPYVLIIDEINRGNISRIFGELITLIEDSKREGAEEALSVTLPYSKEEFFVPDNVYIIGTMNSSDRSLTGLDIALRRRFTFIEMPPKPELLNEVIVNGLNIGKLLEVINQRIEVLLDRDHCIGHANFMSLEKQQTLETLSSIFKQKILPQLQEYFFDDWSKINMVLNANGMLQPKAVVRSAIFPNVNTESESFIEEQKTWELVESAFDSIDSFAKIIKH